MKTEFIDISGQKEKKETIFTHYQECNNGWKKTNFIPKSFVKVVYLGNCAVDGDLFACYSCTGTISILKGIKGSEFL